jgi:nicotinamide mononucleotide (NMN) deamidase PncC
MATRARELAGANIGLAVITDWEQKDTGRMGTGHGYLGIDDGSQTYSFKYTYPGQPLQVKQRSVTGALLELRKILRNGGKHASHN